MSSYKKLFNNSIVFAVGNLGSRLISFVLVPLYTYYLTTAEYGTIDLVTATVAMLLPLVALSVYDAVLRFAMDQDQDPGKVLSNAYLIAIIGFGISCLSFPVLRYFRVLGDSLAFIYLILFVELVERILAHYTRAIGRVKIFAINGILRTFMTGSLNILFLIVFKMGIVGYFISLIMSYLISIIYLSISVKMHRVVSHKYLDRELSKDMLRYSIPLIPNSMMWWLISSASRYMITSFISVSANGLFAVANRIPVVVTLISSIFSQAWQLSAIEEYENKQSESFYRTIFKHYAAALLLTSSLVLVVLKPAFEFVFSTDYYTAWEVVPYLLLSSVFSAFSGFIGASYIAAKKTRGAFTTSVFGGVLSLILNLILIPSIGIVGAGIGSMVSFFAMFYVRYRDTKKIINLNIRWSRFFLNLVFIGLQIMILNSGFDMVVETAIVVVPFVAMLVLNRETLGMVLKLVRSVIRR